MKKDIYYRAPAQESTFKALRKLLRFFALGALGNIFFGGG
jgi:hypothetical protein